MGKILRVNMSDRTATFEAMPDKYKDRAGRWLPSSIVHTDVPATSDPFGEANKLVL